MRDLYECKCPKCGGHTQRVALSATENKRLEKAFNKVARWAYDNKKTDITPDDLDNKAVRGLATEINTVLQTAVTEGIAYEIPEAILQHLKTNVYVFSGGKTYAELRELSDKLLDENGEIKPFSKFFKDVRTIHDDYNKA